MYIFIFFSKFFPLLLSLSLCLFLCLFFSLSLPLFFSLNFSLDILLSLSLSFSLLTCFIVLCMIAIKLGIDRPLLVFVHTNYQIGFIISLFIIRQALLLDRLYYFVHSLPHSLSLYLSKSHSNCLYLPLSLSSLFLLSFF